MNGSFRVIDADRHIIEPADLWDRYLDGPFRGRVTADGERRLVDGRPVMAAPAGHPLDQKLAASRQDLYKEVFADAVTSGFDAASNVRDMDREGVDVAVHFPSTGLHIMWLDGMDPQLSTAICRAYNNWIADFCSYDPVRLKGIGVVALHDVALAVEEIRRAVRELGLVGVTLRPNPLDGKILSDPSRSPIYETLSDLGIPLLIHGAERTFLPQPGAAHYTGFSSHIASHPLDQMLACLTFCADGVLERFPDLTVGFMEAGCGWVPFWLERMDEHWEHPLRGRTRRTKELPSAYFEAQAFVSCEAGEELIGCVVEHLGDANLVMATDYPHPDAVGKFPDRTVGDLVRDKSITDATKHRILWENPARLYHLTDA